MLHMDPFFPAGLPLHVRHSNVSFSLIPIHLNRSVTSQEPPDKNKCPTTGWSKYYTGGCQEPITSHTWVCGSRHFMCCYKKMRFITQQCACGNCGGISTNTNSIFKVAPVLLNTPKALDAFNGCRKCCN